MPTYRNITINLVSQFDILNIPEYAPPTTHSDPFAEAPALVDKSLVSCYIPIYPLSRFWFAYSISAPHPPKALYYFKLFINGACVVSWGCGEENDFKGKTMYALFDSGELWMGEPTVDAMGFGFTSETTHPNPPNGMLGHAMEVRVYRARGRRRIKPDLEDARTVVGKQSQTSNPSGSKPGTPAVKGGIGMFNAGALFDDHPQRYYTYSLLDPLDKPFATFRWYCRTWAQLERLGVTSALESPSESKPDQRPREGTDDEAKKASPKLRPLPSTPNSKIGAFGSPGSTSDISPLTIRGLALPAIPFIDLPRPSSPSESHLQRTRSPAFTSRASTPGRFAQLIRRSSSRSPSPSKADEIKRPDSALSIRRTPGVGVLLGAVQSALRRRGKSSSESLRHVATEGYREKEVPTREGARTSLGHHDGDD
ncbi:MAG: hypothetical protein LQ350_007013 [Teloschistes chrysophthalmus]|nr:MAG: hypothetical protein LQ350_007013 [Niorma chrysophthalma]